MRKLRPQYQDSEAVCARFLSLSKLAAWRAMKNLPIKTLYQRDELINEIWINGYWRKYLWLSDAGLAWLMKMDMYRYMAQTSHHHSRFHLSFHELHEKDAKTQHTQPIEIDDEIIYILKKANLSEASLEMMKLYFWSGLTQKEVGEQLHLSRITVNKSINTILMMMRRIHEHVA